MSKRPRTLIVDDDASARRTLKALLFQEPYDLAFATNGKETLAHLDDHDPDVILLDVVILTVVYRLLWTASLTVRNLCVGVLGPTGRCAVHPWP